MTSTSSFTAGKFREGDANGAPLAGGLLYTYAAGTLTLLATYTDQGGGSANTNPVVLDSAGRANVWFGPVAYRCILKDSLGNVIWDVDNLAGPASIAQLATAAGAGLIGFGRTQTYPAGTVGKALQSMPASLIGDYGAVVNGSTDDSAALSTAAGVSYASGEPILFPSGTAYATSSIPRFHEAQWIGSGAIKRSESGTDYIWYLNPKSTQTNTVYVAATLGDDGNDGISPGKAVATLARAQAIIALHGPVLYTGNWAVQLAAGTYSQGGIDFPVVLANRNRIVVSGPIVNHPNVPTAILEGGGALVYGLNFNSRALVQLSNIKVQNYTTFGIVAQDMADILCTNVHVHGVAGGPGIKIQQGRLRVQGGIIDVCQTGITAIGGATFTIGDPAAASLANGTQILNCTQQGILAQEQSSGHVDFGTITNCAVGLDTQVHSRFHAQGCKITGNATAGVRCVDGSSWYDNGTSAAFATNGVNELIYDAVGEIGRDGNRTLEQKQPIDNTFATLTGSTALTTVKTYASAIASNSFNTSVKCYRLLAYGELTGANTKTLAVTVGGTTLGTVTIPAGAASYIFEAVLHGQSGVAQSFRLSCRVNGQNELVQTGPSAVAMVTGAAIPVTLVAQLANAGDSLTVRMVEQYNYGGC